MYVLVAGISALGVIFAGMFLANLPNIRIKK